MRQARSNPCLVVSDVRGNIFEIPHLLMTGMSGTRILLPDDGDCIAIPRGSDLFMLPGRCPVGFDPRTGKFVKVSSHEGQPVFAVAAFMAPAYVQYLRASYTTTPGAPRLPLYCYTAVGWRHGRFYVAGGRIDSDSRQDLCHFDDKTITAGARRLARSHRNNRLWVHLMRNCVLRYRCPAARNLVMGRWECPVPTSSSCNAACLACISEQPCESCVVSSQERISFVPTVDEIVELAAEHLECAPRPVISFGQGCEGEPLMQGDLLEESIRAIRRRTGCGIINLNTNGSLPHVVERLCKAGLDSIRVSMNSAQEELYTAYHRPKRYSFDDVVETLKVVRRFGRWSSINYFVFPGLTDCPSEMKALFAVIKMTKVNMIQARNLNMDPQWYIEALRLERRWGRPVGIRIWIKQVRERFPWIRFGYFNPPRSVMARCRCPG